MADSTAAKKPKAAPAELLLEPTRDTTIPELTDLKTKVETAIKDFEETKELQDQLSKNTQLLEEKLKKSKKHQQKARLTAKKAETRVNEALTEVSGCKMTVEMLKKTKWGKVIKKVKATTFDEKSGISQIATAQLQRWMDMASQSQQVPAAAAAPAVTSTTPPVRSIPLAASAAKASAANSDSAAEQSAAASAAAAPAPSTKPEVGAGLASMTQEAIVPPLNIAPAPAVTDAVASPAAASPTAHSPEEKRLKARNLLLKTIEKCGAVADAKRPLSEIAAEIEAALFKFSQGMVDKDYTNNFRVLKAKCADGAAVVGVLNGSVETAKFVKAACGA